MIWFAIVVSADGKPRHMKLPQIVPAQIGLCGLFALQWRLIAEGRVQTDAVVQNFDVLKQALPGLFMGSVVLAMDELFLERSEEGLYGSIVPAVAFSTHGAGDAMLSEALLIVFAGVLDATIRMSHKSRSFSCREFALDGHLQGIDDQSAVDPIGHGPAHNLSGVEILNNGQIEPALFGLDVCDVGDPGLVLSRRGKVPVHDVLSDRMIVIRIRGTDPELPSGHLGANSCGFHAFGHGFPGAAMASFPQLPVDS